MLKLVAKLLDCFDEGTDTATFEFAVAFITEVMGRSAAQIFCQHIRVNGGRPCLASKQQCWMQMVDASK